MPSAKPIAAAAACETVSSMNFFTANHLLARCSTSLSSKSNPPLKSAAVQRPTRLAPLGGWPPVFLNRAIASSLCLWLQGEGQHEFHEHLALRRVMPPRVPAALSEKGTAVR